MSTTPNDAPDAAATSPFRPVSASASGATATPGERNLEAIIDIPIEVTIELGRTQMPVRDVIALGRGSVITLDRLAGEPIDIFVSNQKFAEGEVVVVGDAFFGIRITRLLQPNGAPPSA